MKRTAALIVAIAIAEGQQQLVAQELRGTVFESSSRQPVRGAVLMLLDSAGGVLGRNITNERGEYRVNWTRNMRRMRVVRIGFRPREVPVAEPTDANARLDVTMVPIPTFLEQVRVTAKACPRRSNRGSAVALFDQARAGLLATIVAREAAPAAIVTLVYERTMDGTSDRILRQTVGIDSSDRATISFSAAYDAKAFVRRGFMADIAGTSIFFGPDAETLLDDSFASGYCLRVMDPVRVRPHQLGLGFYAADRRPGRVDIDGALWIDTLARSLRDIEFRYVGLDHRLEAYRPGGRIELREMTNGVVFIDRWNLRLLGATADTFPRADGSTTILPRFYATESGGEVASARWRSGLIWKASLGRLGVRASTREGTPAVGTKVWLVDTPYRATADSSGRFEIVDLLPGPYELVVIDPRLDSIGLNIPTPLRFVAVRDSIVRASLVVPTAEDFVIDRCITDKRYVKTDSLLLVRVMRPGGEPVAGARLDVAVTIAPDRSSLITTAGGTPTQPLREGAVTGSDGLLSACSWLLRRRGEVIVKVRHAGVVKTVTQGIDEKRLTIVKVVLDEPPSRPN